MVTSKIPQVVGGTTLAEVTCTLPFCGDRHSPSGICRAAAKPVRYADLGGIEEVLADIREIIEYPLKHPEVSAGEE